MTSSIEVNYTELYEEERAAELLILERILILACVLGIAILVGAFLKKVHSKYFGESAAQIALGVIIGLIVWLGSTLADAQDEGSQLIAISSETFTLLLLPPIIFDAGYATKQMKFFKNFHTILGLAYFGTLFSALFGALLAYLGSLALEAMGLLPFKLTGLQSLLFGSLLSATDTVSVLSVLSHMPIDKNLYMFLFGEAALNDAVAIILFRLFFRFAEAKLDTISAGQALEGVGLMFGVFLGSILLGLGVSMILALILKWFPLQQETEENILVLVCAYIPYLLAERFELSGIVAIFFAGLGMAQYVAKNLSKASKSSSKVLIRVLALSCEAAVFIYMGFAAISNIEGFGQTADAIYNWAFVVLSLLCVVLSRVHVFAIAAASNNLPWFKPRKYIPIKQQLFLWWANLRGGICYILAAQIYGAEHIWANEEGRQFREIVLGTVLALVLLTVVFGGGLTPLVVKWLGLLVKDDGLQDLEELEDGPLVLPNPAGSDRGRSWLVNSVKNFNKRILLPFLTRQQQTYSASFALEQTQMFPDVQDSTVPLDRIMDYNGRMFLVYIPKKVSGPIADALRDLPLDMRSWSQVRRCWILEPSCPEVVRLLGHIAASHTVAITNAAAAVIRNLAADPDNQMQTTPARFLLSQSGQTKRRKRPNELEMDTFNRSGSPSRRLQESDDLSGEESSLLLHK